MADEPLQSALIEEPPAPVDEYVDPESISLAELQHIAPDEEPDEPDEQAVPPPTAAERKRLRDLVTADPAYLQEFEQLAQERDVQTAIRAAAATTARIAAQQQQEERNQFIAARQSQLDWVASHQAAIDAEDARIKHHRQTVDAIDAGPMEAQLDQRRAWLAGHQREMDAAWGAWTQQDALTVRQGQIVAQGETASQARLQESLGNAFRRSAPPEVVQGIAARFYAGKDFYSGTEAWLSDLLRETHEHGFKAGQAATSVERQTERRQTLAQIGLAQPAPDMGGATRGRGAAMTMADLDAMSWEDRTAALKADPLLYDKAATAGRRR